MSETDRRIPARRAYIEESLSKPSPQAAQTLAASIAARHPGSAVLLYGSGASVMADADPRDVLYDFYVIAPSYKEAYGSFAARAANYLLPPNVFYVESEGGLRAKYALLSIGHFEKLVGRRTFHSYFWARFAQPSRIVIAPDAMRGRLVDSIARAIDTFVSRARPLVDDEDDIAALWRAGLNRAYRAELRAEAPDRAGKLLASYGDWPAQVTPAPPSRPAAKAAARAAWGLRAVQGGGLSVLRLLKGTATFTGGVDYIAWKIGRHAGFTLPVRDWERRFPVIAAPFLAARYYRLRGQARAAARS